MQGFANPVLSEASSVQLVLKSSLLASIYVGTVTVLTALCLSAHAQSSPHHNPMLHQHGTRIVDEHGNEVKLRGVNLGGWLLWE
jgi:hypothetical protein